MIGVNKSKIIWCLSFAEVLCSCAWWMGESCCLVSVINAHLTEMPLPIISTFRYIEVHFTFAVFGRYSLCLWFFFLRFLRVSLLLSILLSQLSQWLVHACANMTRVLLLRETIVHWPLMLCNFMNACYDTICLCESLALRKINKSQRSEWNKISFIVVVHFNGLEAWWHAHRLAE